MITPPLNRKLIKRVPWATRQAAPWPWFLAGISGDDETLYPGKREGNPYAKPFPPHARGL